MTRADKIGLAVGAFMIAAGGFMYWGNQQEETLTATFRGEAPPIGNGMISYKGITTDKGDFPLERNFDETLTPGTTYNFTFYKTATSPFIIGTAGVIKDAKPTGLEP